MFKLFKDLEIPKEVVSTEMIAIQTNDYIVPALTEQFRLLIEAADKYNLTESASFFKNKATKSIYDRIDTLLHDRFGIVFKHISNPGSPYAIYPVTALNNSNINRTVETNYDDIEEYLKEEGGYNSTNNVDVTNLGTASDYIALFSNWKKSVDELGKVLNAKGVHIDLQKAKVTGLPSAYFMYLLTDPFTLIYDLKLTADELVAVMLHEVGHGFTHLEYSYRSVRTTSVLMDTLQENLLNKNKTFKETLRLVYENALNGDVKDIDKSSTPVALIKVIDKYIEETLYLDNGVHASTDSEQLADQFAGRFGVQIHLATALNKIHVIYKEYGKYFIIHSTIYLYVVSAIYIMLLSGVVSTGLIAGAYAVVITYAIIFIHNTIISIITSGNTTTEQTYDSAQRRLIRIKNEMTRQIRSSKLDKKVTSQMLHDIDGLNKLIEASDSFYDESSLVDKLFMKYSTKARHNLLLKEIEQNIEDLSENDLYLASQKLKQTGVKV